MTEPPDQASAAGGGGAAQPLADLAALLGTLPLLSGLPADVLAEVAAQTRRRVVPARHVLCHAGEVGDAFYVISRGKVQVLAPAPEGEEVVANLGPGEWFGEMALITGEPRSATVIATTETELVVLERDAFQQLLRRSPTAAMSISDVLSRRLRAHLLSRPPQTRPRTIVAVAPATAEARRVLLNLAAALHDQGRVAVTLVDAAAGDGSEIPDGVSVASALSDHIHRSAGLVVVRVDPARVAAELTALQPDAAWALGADAAHALAAAAPELACTTIEWGAAVPLVRDPTAARFDRSILAGSAVVRTDPHSPTAAALRRLARAVLHRRIGIAFSAGGARGIAHIGAVRCFERAGIELDMIAGTSMGGIVGGGLAYGMGSAQLYDLVRRISENLRRELLDFGLPDEGLLRGRKKSEIFRRQAPTVRFEDLPTPFWAVAADLVVSGREIVLNSGLVWQAVDATSSIPGIFPPVRIGSQSFVDGWIVNSLPADVLRREGADIVLAVCVSAGRPTSEEPLPVLSPEPGPAWRRWLRRVTSPSIGRNVMTAIDIGARERTLANLALVDACVTPNLKGITVSDFRRLDEIVERGEAAAEAMLPAIRAALRGPGG